MLLGIIKIVGADREPLRRNSEFVGEALAIGEHPAFHCPHGYSQTYPRCNLAALEETIDQFRGTRGILIKVA